MRTYFQDDWRVNDRLTLNLGLRYDLVKGYQLDQSNNPNYVLAQQLGAAGPVRQRHRLRELRQECRRTTPTTSSRASAWCGTCAAMPRIVVRAGWGIYTDFGYTNSNVLFAAADAGTSRFGTVFTANDTAGLRNPDGSFYRVGQPLTNLAAQNEAGALPLFGQWVDPRLEQPETLQTAVGWSHELSPSTVISADYVHIDGRKLNVRPRLNTRINGGPASSPTSPSVPTRAPPARRSAAASRSTTG